MSETDILQRVLEIGPNEKGEGMSVVLFWDGAEKALAIGQFDGQEVTTEITPDRLLLDVKDLKEQACNGDLQVVFHDGELEAKLKAYIDG